MFFPLVADGRGGKAGWPIVAMDGGRTSVSPACHHIIVTTSPSLHVGSPVPLYHGGPGNLTTLSTAVGDVTTFVCIQKASSSEDWLQACCVEKPAGDQARGWVPHSDPRPRRPYRAVR